MRRSPGFAASTVNRSLTLDLPSSVPVRWPTFFLLLVGLLAAGCGSSSRPVPRVASAARWPAPARRETVARRSACTGPRADPSDYGWPIKPFDVQHPVRGNFGDPRTISAGRLGLDDRGDPGDYSFHNGVDIAADRGTPVFAVVSGIASLRAGDDVLVRSPGVLRSFSYKHITPRVRNGEHVIADRTVLGYVKARAEHVHLDEIDGDRITNPALHLRPYADRTPPTVTAITIRDSRGRLLEPHAISGTVSISADASDTPPVPVPGAWGGFPVTPALVRWTLADPLDRRTLLSTTAADFRRFEPEQRDFWNVYAAGTYQNFPVFDHHDYWRHAGRYVFDLTRKPLDTRSLRNGLYRIRVIASDICGNRGTLTEFVRIANT